MNVITDTAALREWCAKLAAEPFVTVDLEFLREHHYYAQLCLIQLGSRRGCTIVDPLAEGIDLQPFFELMQSPQTVKVFHSGRQDIEIIYNLSNHIPTPLFDTQIAAMAVGFGESASYESLVAHLLHRSLDKSSRLSDWSIRPLTETQLNYALSDVTHLMDVYEQLKQTLTDQHRESWIVDEMAVLSNPETYQNKPEEMWTRIHHRSHNARFLTFLRELAAWRERRSQSKNTPRQSYIKDDMLLAVCAAEPQTKEQLCKIRNLRHDIAAGRLGDEIIEVLNRCRKIPETDYVTPPKFKDFPDKSSALTELLKMLLKIVSQQENIVARLIATEDMLQEFSAFHNAENPILSGWRYQIFGSRAEALRRGALAISFNPESRRIEFTEKEAPKNCAATPKA